jgi:hypothetical protein
VERDEVVVLARLDAGEAKRALVVRPLLVGRLDCAVHGADQGDQALAGLAPLELDPYVRQRLSERIDHATHHGVVPVAGRGAGPSDALHGLERVDDVAPDRRQKRCRLHVVIGHRDARGRGRQVVRRQLGPALGLAAQHEVQAACDEGDDD